MSREGSAPQGVEYMLPVLTQEELTEMRFAIKQRARSNGTGTKQNKLCLEILRKMDEAEKNPHPVTNGTHKKVAGVNSEVFKEF